MREVDFIARLQELVDSPISGVDADSKARILHAASERVRRGEARLECRFVPFVPGRRPTDEALHPGLGSSERSALVVSREAPRDPDNTAYVMFDVSGCTGEALELDVTLSFVGLDGSIVSGAVPGWDRRPVRAMAFDAGNGSQPQLREVSLGASSVERLVLTLSPERDLFPGSRWPWEGLDSRLRDGATDTDDPYTFGHLFAQDVSVELRVTDGGVPVAGAKGRLFACDAGRFGSLYQRLVERLVAPDTARQALEAGCPDPGAAFHP